MTATAPRRAYNDHECVTLPEAAHAFGMSAERLELAVMRGQIRTTTRDADGVAVVGIGDVNAWIARGSPTLPRGPRP